MNKKRKQSESERKTNQRCYFHYYTSLPKNTIANKRNITSERISRDSPAVHSHNSKSNVIFSSNETRSINRIETVERREFPIFLIARENITRKSKEQQRKRKQWFPLTTGTTRQHVLIYNVWIFLSCPGLNVCVKDTLLWFYIQFSFSLNVCLWNR